MEPLDLRLAPPRSPHETLGVTVFFARTIDKFRATLPGGNVGDYKIAGTSARLLERLGITEEAFAAHVASARDDAEVAQWVLNATSSQAREEANEHYRSLTIRDCLDVPDFFGRYPIAKNLPVDTALLDMLCADDRASFETKEPV